MVISILLATLCLTCSDASSYTLQVMSGFASSSPSREAYTQSQSAEFAEANELEKTIVKLYREQKYKEALPLAKRVLQIREKVPDQDIQSLRTALLNLAELYFALGKYGDAESSYERVIASYKKLNPNDVRLADILERLGLVHYARDNLTKAESAYQEALRLKETVLGLEDARTMRSVFAVAEFYHFSEAYEKAVPYYQRLLLYREKIKGPKQLNELAEVVDRYGCTLRKLNRGAEADNIERLFGPAGEPANQSDASVLANVLNGRAVNLPRPAYPAKARDARATGRVVVRVLIDEKGDVVRACAIKGPPLLARTSEVAAYGAKFTPTLQSGVPVKATGIIVYNFIVR